MGNKDLQGAAGQPGKGRLPCADSCGSFCGRSRVWNAGGGRGGLKAFSYGSRVQGLGFRVTHALCALGLGNAAVSLAARSKASLSLIRMSRVEDPYQTV